MEKYIIQQASNRLSFMAHAAADGAKAVKLGLRNHASVRVDPT
jgi:hypothetical protein